MYRLLDILLTAEKERKMCETYLQLINLKRCYDLRIWQTNYSKTSKTTFSGHFVKLSKNGQHFCNITTDRQVEKQLIISIFIIFPVFLSQCNCCNFVNPNWLFSRFYTYLNPNLNISVKQRL